MTCHRCCSLACPGHTGGRYLNDVWVLNLDSLVWQLITTTAKPLPPIGGGSFDEIKPAENKPLLGHSKDDSKPRSTAALPPSAGHVLVAWGSHLLCIGGHTKAGTYSHLRKVLPSCLPHFAYHQSLRPWMCTIIIKHGPKSTCRLFRQTEESAFCLNVSDHTMVMLL